jgi:hypothetical protein
VLPLLAGERERERDSLSRSHWARGGEGGRHAAMKCGEEGAGAAKRKKDMDRQRALLVTATQSLCTALLDVEQAAAEWTRDSSVTGESDVEAAFRQLRCWDDISTTLLGARWEERRGNSAAALTTLAKVLSESDGPAPKVPSRLLLPFVSNPPSVDCDALCSQG